MSPSARLVAFALVLLALPACSGPLAEGEAQFEKGRYPAAKQAFVELERASRRWDDGRRARYALYRGLTHTALGDRGQAGVWLREAKAIEDAHPGALSPVDAHRLAVGLDTNDLE